MRACRISVLVLIAVTSLFLPVVVGDSDEEALLSGVQKISVTVVPTEPVPYGSEESMTGYQRWLEENASALIRYTDLLLAVFGIDGFGWPGGNGKSAPVATVSPTHVPTFSAPPDTPVQRSAVRESPGMTTIASITGDSGYQTAKVTVPSGYWELWYTADPLITGAQDSHSATGTHSAVFPVLKIVVSEADSNVEVETVEPPGGLDKTLWQRSGDPRPWSRKFYTGNKEFAFDIEAHHLRSYALDIRVRTSDYTPS